MRCIIFVSVCFLLVGCGKSDTHYESGTVTDVAYKGDWVNVRAKKSNGSRFNGRNLRSAIFVGDTVYRECWFRNRERFCSEFVQISRPNLPSYAEIQIMRVNND